MQTEEQEKLSIEEKSNLFVQLLEAMKHFAAMRAQEKRNNPPTKAQKRNTMSTYLKNIVGYKQNQLKNKSFNDIYKLFDKAMKNVNTFCRYGYRIGRRFHKEGKKTYYQIIRVDGSLKMYLVFTHMLKSFDREDLETLWKLVKAKHGSTRPKKGYERIQNWRDLPRFDTSAGNPVKEILLKLNLPDHRILKDGGEEFQERCLIQAFKTKKQQRYEHVGPKVTSSQDGKFTRRRKEIMLG
ncbi:hypothetical protein Tco_1428909 [Tanacetum coccineum]